MAFYGMKGSYLAELTHELTTLDLTSSKQGRDGTKLDESAIRASRYDKQTEQGMDYVQLLNNLCQQAMTELALLTVEEANGILSRFELLQKRYDEAREVVDKQQQLFPKDEFESSNFENEFFHLFSLPTSGPNSSKYDGLIISDDFFYDLYDAIELKQSALSCMKEFMQLRFFPDRKTDDPTRGRHREIKFRPETQSKLFDQLSPHVDDQLEALQLVLNGEQIASSILLSCDQTTLGKIFQKIRQQDLMVKPRECSHWIYKYFRRYPSAPNVGPRFSVQTLIKSMGLSKEEKRWNNNKN